MNTHITASIACAAMLAAAATVSADVINPDFSSGFAGWEGALTDPSFSIVSVDPAADSRYSLVGGAARLSNEVDYFEVALFQSFTIPLNAQSLSFDYEWLITCEDAFGACATAVDPFGANDIVQALLFDAGHSTVLANLFSLAGVSTNVLSASGTATVDIASLAGQDAILEFFVGDGDYNEQDWLEVDNIAISRAVPLPGTVPLLLIGLGGLGWSRCARRGPGPSQIPGSPRQAA